MFNNKFTVIPQIPLTEEQELTQVKNKINTIINTSFDRTAASLMVGFKMFWENEKFTPEQIAAAYGTDAIKLFMIAGAMQQTLNSIVPGSVPFESPKQVTPNGDGSVTITDFPQP